MFTLAQIFVHITNLPYNVTVLSYYTRHIFTFLNLFRLNHPEIMWLVVSHHGFEHYYILYNANAHLNVDWRWVSLVFDVSLVKCLFIVNMVFQNSINPSVCF